MKKTFRALWLTVLAVLMVFAFAGCGDSALKEVAGTYEMTSISGTVNGITVTKDMYAYFRIILDEKGNGTVQSKPSAVGGAAYEAKGTYKYEDGKIKMTTRSGAASITEEYNYSNGVITYTLNQQGMNVTIRLTRVTENSAD